jgi:hypothetical protein
VKDVTACLRIDYKDYIELAFQESSQEAVDELIHHLVTILQGLSSADTLRVFINSREAQRAQPIIYLMGRLREKQAVFKTQRRTRIAVTFHLMPLAQMVTLFVRALRMPNIDFRAFHVDQEAQALAWLLKD